MRLLIRSVIKVIFMSHNLNISSFSHLQYPGQGYPGKLGVRNTSWMGWLFITGHHIAITISQRYNNITIKELQCHIHVPGKIFSVL